jgi:hypothetical protein
VGERIKPTGLVTQLLGASRLHASGRGRRKISAAPGNSRDCPDTPRFRSTITIPLTI